MNLSRHNINCQCQNCRGRGRVAVATRRPEPAPAKTATTPPKNEAAPEPAPPKRTKAPPPARSFLSAFAADFKRCPSEKGAVIPLEQQHGEGGYALKRGVATIPEDGFYMLLWELGVIRAEGVADLRLGINQEGTVLSEDIAPGYDSGQQVTWLCRGDELSLQLVGEGEQPEIHGNCARLTVLRMG